MKITKTKRGYTAVVYLGQTADKKSITRRISAPDRAEVVRRASELMSEHHLATKSTVFSDATDRYISSREPHRSASTIRSYKSIARTLKSSYGAFCELKVDEITDAAVQSVVDSLKRSGHSAKTVRNWIGLINAVLIAERHRPASVTLSRRAAPDREIPTYGEIRMILCLLHGHRLEVPVKLALLGLRRGEICALSPSDLDDSGVLHVHRSKVIQDGGGHVTNSSPKTDASNRYIQLSPDLASLIRERGVTSLLPNGLTRAFSKFLRDYRFPPYRLHDCRHFFASYCHSIGIPEADILAGGGWKTPNVMKRVYRHSMAQNAASAAISKIF